MKAVDAEGASFSLLGPFQVHVGDRAVEIGAPRVRALLAVLLLHANEVVSADRLIDELWGPEPPASASHALQVYVSEARKALGAARATLETRPPGYLVRVGPDELDLHRFEAGLADARDALADGDPATARRLFDEAFSLWRGETLSDFAYEPFAQVAIMRVEELRLAAEEDRMAAELALGRHREVLPRLQELARAHPLRERLHEHAVLALYRSGRQAEALQAYQDARAALVDGLGIEPSKALQELERRILNQDPSLDLSEAPPRSAVGAPVGAERSILVVGFGRADEHVVRVAERLAAAPSPHRLIDAVLVDAAAGDATRALQDANRSLAAWRRDAAERGLAASATAFTSADCADDVLRLAAQQDVDLVLLDQGSVLDDAGQVHAPEILEACAADVGLVWPRALRDDLPVAVPFAGSDHDWAALELAVWLATALGTDVRLLGAEGGDGVRDASRLLGSAALAVQQLSSVPTQTELVPRGTGGVLRVAQEAAALVLSLPDRWQSDGIGRSRLELGRQADAPVLLMRRGLRPGGLAPAAALTRFTWSLSRT